MVDTIKAAFDPAEWLARFTAMGGHFASTSAGVWLSGPPDARLTSYQQDALRDPAMREAIKAHILAMTPQEAHHGD